MVKKNDKSKLQLAAGVILTCCFLHLADFLGSSALRLILVMKKIISYV